MAEKAIVVKIQQHAPPILEREEEHYNELAQIHRTGKMTQAAPISKNYKQSCSAAHQNQMYLAPKHVLDEMEAAL